MRAPVWRNFVVSFGASVAWAAWRLAWNLADFDRLRRSAPGGYGERAVLWPAVIGGIQLLLWFFVYSEERADSRVWAGVMGFNLLALLGFNLMMWGLTGGTPSVPDLALLLYVGASHLTFAILGRR